MYIEDLAFSFRRYQSTGFCWQAALMVCYINRGHIHVVGANANIRRLLIEACSFCSTNTELFLERYVHAGAVDYYVLQWTLGAGTSLLGRRYH